MLHVCEKLIGKLPQGFTLIHSAILRCALLVFGSHGCLGGMAFGDEVTAMSHGVFPLS